MNKCAHRAVLPVSCQQKECTRGEERTHIAVHSLSAALWVRLLQVKLATTTMSAVQVRAIGKKVPIGQELEVVPVA
jgi:hypothetical protein